MLVHDWKYACGCCAAATAATSEFNQDETHFDFFIVSLCATVLLLLSPDSDSFCHFFSLCILIIMSCICCQQNLFQWLLVNNVSHSVKHYYTHAPTQTPIYTSMITARKYGEPAKSCAPEHIHLKMQVPENFQF